MILASEKVTKFGFPLFFLSVRLPTPHGDCEDRDVIKRGSSFVTYAANTCKRRCAAEQLVEKCSCVDPSTAQGLVIENDSVPFCYSLHLPREQLLKQLKCLEENKFDIGSDCGSIDRCPHKCERSKFETRVSQANWPMDTLVTSFYETMIKGKSFQKLFEPYFNTSRCQQDSDPFCNSTVHNIQTQMVMNNFLKCDVYMNAGVQVVLTESEKTSLVNLLSALGGI